MSSPAQTASTETYPETARYLQSGTETVFALCTSSVTAPADLGVVLAHSGANNFSAHRNGVWTRLAGRLAREGIPALRFDFAGTGESSGNLVLGLTGQPVTDTTVAMDALRESGCRRLLLVGSCFGGIPSVVAAAARADVAGVILLGPPLVLPGAGGKVSLRDRVRGIVNLPALRTAATNREYRRWFLAWLMSLARTTVTVKLGRLVTRPFRSRAPEPGAGASPGRGLLVESELARLVTAGNHVEVVYGTCDDNLARVEGDPEASRAIRLLQDRHSGLVLTVLDGSVHGLEDVAIQEQLIELVVQRVCGLMGRAPLAAE